MADVTAASATQNLIAAAREVDALFTDKKDVHGEWILDGEPVTEDAATALLSMHGYLNDLAAEAGIGESILKALAGVKHCGDGGLLWIHAERRLVHLTMGDSDGQTELGFTGFDEIRELTTAAAQEWWQGWSAGVQDMGGLEGGMEIADEWSPNEEDGWVEVGSIGQEV